VLSEKSQILYKVEDRLNTLKDINNFLSFTDHAWLNKNSIKYDDNGKTLIFLIKRYNKHSKAIKRFLFFRVVYNRIPPEITSKVTIKNIEKIDIINKTTDPSYDEVIISRIIVEEDKINISDFCGREEIEYTIKIRTNKIEIVIEDLD